jgi:ribosome maturation factor RimP
LCIERGDLCPLFLFINQIFVEMTTVEKRAAELVEEKLAEKPGVFLVSVKMHSNGKLIILIDGDNGLGITDCVDVSRHVGYHLEEENVVDEAYNLEVSSPGIDTPLTLPRQYVKNVGRQVAIKTTDGRIHEGKLLEFNTDHVLIEETKKEKGKKAELVENAIPVDTITETKVLISFK